MIAKCTCDDCEHEFEVDIPDSDEEWVPLECPKCGSVEIGWSEYFGDDDGAF